MVVANGHGGARPGAGRKKKPLADKLMEGNPGKRPNKVLGFAEGLPHDMELPEYLEDFAGFDIEPDVNEFYRSTVKWLERTGCLHMINPDFIAEYAMLKTRWLECEFIVGSLFAHHRISMATTSADMGLKYLKQADAAWGKIWAIVAQNCEYNLGSENPNAEIMAALLSAKPE